MLKFFRKCLSEFEFLEYVKYIIVGFVLILSVWFLTALFWKSLGFETIKNETVFEKLEVTEKNENPVVISGGKGAVTVWEYYIVVLYEKNEYPIKVQENFFEKIHVGDYVECEINSKEKENGFETIGIELDYH